jgi:polyisoprenyl-phosphate glycosyltransferase
MFREKQLLSIVVPVYNEEESLAESASRLTALAARMSPRVDVEIIFVDDGSSDSSLAELRQIAARTPCVKAIALSRNFGHQIAITAGIDVAAGDYVAIIDADLQDPPELIEDMYLLAVTGVDVVYGKRRSRAGETIFKKATATAFYSLLSYACEIDIPSDTGDFRLMSRRVTESFRQLRERHRFVRGMVPWLGFRSAAIDYDRAPRFAGTTKYPFRKMLHFAANAILSFSTKPLAIAIRLGLLTIAGGALGGLVMLYLKLFTNLAVPGITAVLLTVVLFSGIQIVLIGVVGEYVARIFEEAKGRPLYLVAETINVDAVSRV